MTNTNKEEILLTKKKKPIDIIIAKRLKIHIELSGITRVKLAKLLNISVQQFCKYENGKNRISAGSLLLVLEALGCKIQDFFESNEFIDTLVDYESEKDSKKMIDLIKIARNLPESMMDNLSLLIADAIEMRQKNDRK